MSVRIGQKHRRGVAGEKTVTCPGFQNVDVTSGGHKLLGPDKIPSTTLSPMRLGPVTDAQGNRAEVFENSWQGAKMWRSAGHIVDGTEAEPTEKYFAFRRKIFASVKGKRRPLPKSTHGFPCAARYNGRAYGYIESRKEIYVAIYYRLIKNLPAVKAMQKMIADGQSVMIIDGDGPPRDLYPQGMQMNEANWRKMIEDPHQPFGHGYVVAAVVAGLPESVILGDSPPPFLFTLPADPVLQPVQKPLSKKRLLVDEHRQPTAKKSRLANK